MRSSSSCESQHRDEGDFKKEVFFLTKPQHSDRAKLCFLLMEGSKNPVLYLAGDGVFNLLGSSIEGLPQGSVHACREDMSARGVQSVDLAISIKDFFEQLVKDVMLRSDRVYTF
jgi:sulfur transfer complex TusBCD TusB component (DsrH family)